LWVGRRFDLRGQPQQGVEGGHRIEPAIEPEHELLEVVLEVVCADATMCAPQPRPEVGDDAMDPRHDDRRVGLAERALGPKVMAVAAGEQAVVARPDGAVEVEPGTTLRSTKAVSVAPDASSTTSMRSRPRPWP